MAKLIIKLINDIADVINNDPDIQGKIKVVFLANYRVSLAEKIIPASDISEQISTAGKEASGTGNMKFALNGALTVGTLDGANIEIREEVGAENFFLFGKTVEELDELRPGYNPRDYYLNDPRLKRVIDSITGGFFNTDEPDLYKPIWNALLEEGDPYFHLADFDSYLKIQEEVDATYLNQEKWTKMCLQNIVRIGKFSSDRTIAEYAKEVWNIKACKIELPVDDKVRLIKRS
jgi:starch phosphorylase